MINPILVVNKLMSHSILVFHVAVQTSLSTHKQVDANKDGYHRANSKQVPYHTLPYNSNSNSNSNSDSKDNKK